MTMWTVEDVQALAASAQHVRRVCEEDALVGEKQRHLQGLCLRMLRELTRQGSKTAID